MPGDTHDLSPEDLLERRVREAYLGQDFAQVQDLLRGENVPNGIKDSVLTAALREGNLPLVRFVVEDARVALTPERCIMLVFLACQSQRLDVVLYLSEKTAQLGLERSDAYELVFSRFPAEKHAAAADELLARAGDRQDALNKMLYVAAASGAFDVIPHLLDLGADANANAGTVIYMLTTACPPACFAAREKYLGLMEKYLEKFDDRGVLDTALAVVAFKITDDTQYPEVVAMMLDKGADPFAGHGEALRHLAGTFRRLDRPADAERWENVFSDARQKDVLLHRRQFETLFKTGFRVADLRQTVNDDGDTGFMLAAKGRVLDQVVAAAIREGNAQLAAPDLLTKNIRNQSLLSLAVDRDDLCVLLEPAYWAKADAGILRAVEQNLTSEQKPWVDMHRLSSQLDQYKLKQQAVRFRLRMGPK